MIVVSSPLGFNGTTIKFEEVPFPGSLENHKSYVGHPATRQLLEALGASTDVSNNGNPGRWAGPAVNESYLAVPLTNNTPAQGWTQDVAIKSTSELRAILCTRVA